MSGIVDGFGTPVTCEYCRYRQAQTTVLTNAQTLEWCDLCSDCNQVVLAQQERAELEHEAMRRLEQQEVHHDE